MRTLVAGTALAVFLGLASLAQAAQLLSPPLPTNVNTSATCYIRNTGTTPVTVEVSLFSNNGLVVSFDNCNTAPLLAGHTCLVQVNDLPDSSYAACRVTASSVSKLLGTLEVREVSFNPIARVLVAEDLK
jgi:hypothetical protein